MGAGCSTTTVHKVVDEPEPRAREIRVSVNRDGTKPVGVRVQIEVGSLIVLEIQAGLIKTWNEEHPSQAVHPGDEIASVNGHKGQSEILTELQLTKHELDIVFVRNPSPSEVPGFRAVITRTSSSRDLGMDVDQDSGGLIVSNIHAGLVRDWNNAQASHSSTLQAGVRILSVNGLTDLREMRRELASAATVHIAATTRRIQRRRSSTSSGELVKVVQLPFVKASDCGDGGEPQVCGICLDDVDADSCVVRLACTHIFHVECATKWLTKCNCACPVCRSPVAGNISRADTPTELGGPRLPSLVRA